MPHPLVLQLRFTRSEFQRGLAGLSDEDARRRILQKWARKPLGFRQGMNGPSDLQTLLKNAML